MVKKGGNRVSQRSPSIVSASSAASQKDLKIMLLKVNEKNFKNKQLIQMISLLTIPVILTIIVSGFHFSSSLEKRNSMMESQDVILINKQVLDLVLAIQLERSRSTLFVSSAGADLMKAPLEAAQNDLDEKLLVLNQWPPANFVEGSTFERREDFKKAINIYRTEIVNLHYTETDILKHYSKLTTSFLKWGINLYLPLHVGDLWPSIASKYFMFAAIDQIGLVQSLGSMHYYNCDYPVHLKVWVTNIRANIRILIDRAIQNDPLALGNFFGEDQPGDIMNIVLEEKLHEIYSEDFTSDCQDLDIVVIDSLSDQFVSQMTLLVDIIKRTSAKVEKKVTRGIEAETNKINQEVITVITVMVILIGGTIATSLWYIQKVWAILTDLSKRATQTIKVSRALSAEKKRTDRLFYQSLPESVAHLVKNGIAVDVVQFTSASIFFSKMVGFDTICRHSRSSQVTKFLTGFYTAFDEIIEAFDVYKLETIIDSYMVVSGIPTPNGSRHLMEVADMALCLMSKCERMEVPHLVGDDVQIRAGIHTGSMTAGVVGQKMYRYCVFGETVKAGAQMSIYGKASKIQVTQEYKDAVDKEKNQSYVFKKRKDTDDLKKMDMRVTYWLYAADNYNALSRIQKREGKGVEVDFDELNQVADNEQMEI